MKKSCLYYSCFGLIMSFVALTGCTSETTDTPKKASTSAPKPKSAFQIGRVSQQNLSETMQLPGEFKPFQEVSIYPKANGFVEKVLVDRGSQVKKGQVLMVLEAPETEEQLVAARSSFLKADALLAASREHYRRLKASSKTPGSVSPLDLETAYARMMADSASSLGERANYRVLNKLKSYLTVRAPFDGVIVERNVHPGALVGGGARQERPMLILQQQNKLRLVVDIPEAYSLNLKEGSTLTFTVNALPGREFKGKISRRSGNMNQQFRSEIAEIDIDNKAQTFRPGMFAEIILEANGHAGALAVPASAVVSSTERQYVIKVEEGRAKHIEVRRGHRAGDQVEVFGNLRAEDNIIVNAREDIREGSTVL